MLTLHHNLASTWISVCESRGEIRADSLRRLNARTMSKYTHSRLNEWCRGDRYPDRQARIVMLLDVLPVVFAHFGVNLSPTRCSELAEAIA